MVNAANFYRKGITVKPTIAYNTAAKIRGSMILIPEILLILEVLFHYPTIVRIL